MIYTNDPELGEVLITETIIDSPADIAEAEKIMDAKVKHVSLDAV